LTWKAGICYVYKKTTFEVMGVFNYKGEGWGLTHDGANLIMSNGSSVLRFLDPVTFNEVKVIEVVYDGAPMDMLNELEFVNGIIYANVWKTDYVACIDPGSGYVIGWLDASGLRKHLDYNDNIDVLNGIANDGEYFYLTGKLWPNIFKLKFVRCDLD
jgi:glutamine cyclotransferase